MDLIVITGNHPRHSYFAKNMKKLTNNSFHIVQKREDFTPLSKNKIEEGHFHKRSEKEAFYFGNIDISGDLEVEADDLLNDTIYEKLLKLKPKVLLVYGSGLIGPKISQLAKNYNINLHGGLSPYYKGSATHFWPSYFLEPEFTGVTFHTISKKIDAGDIIHQTSVDLSYGDTLHDLSCKVIKKSIDEFSLLVPLLIKNLKVYKQKQVKNGKLFLKKDLRLEHLKFIYEFFNDDIADWKLNNGNIQEFKIFNENIK